MSTLANPEMPQLEQLAAPSATGFAGSAVSPQLAIAGVGGYAGAELARLLLHHPRFTSQNLAFFGRPEEAPATHPSRKPEKLFALHPQLASNQLQPPDVKPFSWDALAASGTQILLLATPHEQSREWAPQAIAQGLRVIDLSGAWRLEHQQNRDVYKFEDKDPALAAALQTAAVYGSPELHRQAIRTARLVANPGCYATSIILALAPFVQAGLVDLDHGIVCDAKSGVSGAGKAPTSKTHFMYAADNLSAYAVFNHRHTGEMLEQLHLTPDQIQFTPHLLPIPRGILSTIYLRLAKKQTSEELEQSLRAFYTTSPMVRIHKTPHLPQIQHVVRTNFCDLGFELHPDGRRLVVVSCLDNLLKGAASQAVQNLNLMCGWNEEEGLL